MRLWAIRIASVGVAFGLLICLSSAWAPVQRVPTQDSGLMAD